MNYSMFRRRAEQDPEASQKTGLAKMFAGWKLMLSDDKKALKGETSGKAWAEERSSLRSDD